MKAKCKDTDCSAAAEQPQKTCMGCGLALPARNKSGWCKACYDLAFFRAWRGPPRRPIRERWAEKLLADPDRLARLAIYASRAKDGKPLFGPAGS